MKAIVLAAGCSSRMGQQKQLLIWQGKTLLQHAIDKLNKAGFDVITVIGSAADEIQQHISHTQVVVNEHWCEGMGSSIALAIKKLNFKDTAVLITQPDQVALNSHDFLLLKSHSLRWPKKIICSCFHGAIKGVIKGENNEFITQKIISVPAIFPSEYFPELMKLNKNNGARKIIQQAMDEAEEDTTGQKVVAISLQNAAININTPDEWHYWQQSQNIDFSSDNLLFSKMEQKET